MFITSSIKYPHFLSVLGQPWKVEIAILIDSWGCRVVNKLAPHEGPISGTTWICPSLFYSVEARMCAHPCPGKLCLYRAESCPSATFPRLFSFCPPRHSASEVRSLFHMTALHIPEKGFHARFPTTPYLSLSFLKNVERCFYSQMPWEISWFLDSCWVCPDVPIFVLYDIN